MKLSKSYVDAEGRVMAVTMPMPEMPKDIHPRDQYLKAMGEYDKAIQQVKDTSVVYEDQAQAVMFIRSHNMGQFASTFELQPDTFYDHDTVEVELQHQCWIYPEWDDCSEDQYNDFKRRGFTIQIVARIVMAEKTQMDKPSKDWDTVLTDAIVETQGSIKPYSRILKYLSDNYTITRKPLPSPPKP